MLSVLTVGYGLLAGVNQPLCSASVVVGSGHDQFVADNAGDRRSVGIAGNGDLHRHAVVAGSNVRLPAEPDDGVTLLLHEAVAGLGQRIDVAGIRRTTGNVGVDERKAALVAAIDDVEEQHAVCLAAISRPQDVDVGGILDHALGIFRRERDVLDHGVRRQLRIDLAIGLADHPLVDADFAEAAAAKGRLGLGDLETHDPRLRNRGRKRHESDGCRQDRSNGLFQNRHNCLPQRCGRLFVFLAIVTANLPTIASCRRDASPPTAPERRIWVKIGSRSLGAGCLLCPRYCCKSRKSSDPKNLAKVDLWTPPPLCRFSTPLQRRSLVDFGPIDMVPRVAARSPGYEGD